VVINLKAMSARAQPDPIPNIPPPTWAFFRESFENAPPGRPVAWREVGLWAIDRLSERLGEDWPERAWKKNGRLPAGMAWAGSHTAAYVELIELALRLELLCDREGFADVCRPLKRDPREDQIPHLRLELEVGTLAARVGCGVRFERPIPDSSKTSDIIIDLEDGQSLLVEARVLLPDERSVDISRFTDEAFESIRLTCQKYEVECSGEMTELLDEEKFAELLDAVETQARLVRAGAIAPPVRLHGANLQVTGRGAGPGKGLYGPALSGDLWPRIADRLDQKARQTEGAQNVWLRICALQGLWLFTHWANLDLPGKLATMRQNMLSGLSDHPHVDGVVISSASAWPQGTITDDQYNVDACGYALRRHIPPIMARETLIVPLNAGAQTTSHARIWRGLYDSEPEWLDYALGKFDLPAVAEIFPPSD
jgi:hypothetical protein